MNQRETDALLGGLKGIFGSVLTHATAAIAAEPLRQAFDRMTPKARRALGNHFIAAGQALQADDTQEAATAAASAIEEIKL